MKSLARPLGLALQIYFIAGLSVAVAKGGASGSEIKSVPGALKPVKKIDSPVRIVIESIHSLSNAGLVELVWALESTKPLYDLEIVVRSSDNLTIEGPTKWPLKLNGKLRSKHTLTAIVPENDSSVLSIWVIGKHPRAMTHTGRFFVTTGDTLEVYRQSPHSVFQPSSAQKSRPTRDELTPKQLQTEFEVRLDVRDSAKLEFALQLLGEF